MAVKTKSKKTETPLKDIKELFKEAAVPGRLASPITCEYVYSSYNNDGVTDAPYDRTADTDIQKRVQDEIDTLYPRTRVGLEGILDAVLRELIRARLSR